MLRYNSLFAVTILSLFLVGCSGPRALRSSYVDYSNAYADAGNQQMLLNLARIHNGHPPYFLQVGPITAQYTFSAGLDGNYNRLHAGGLVPDTITSALGINGSAGESPTFNFVPLNGPGFSAILLKPLEPKVIYSLAGQGISIGMLVRMAVEKFTLQFPGQPAIAFYNHFSDRDPSNYKDFLRLVAHLQNLQAVKLLPVESNETGSLQYTITPNAMRVIKELSAKQPEYRIEALKSVNTDGDAKFEIKTRTFLGVLYAMSFEMNAFKSLPPDFFNSVPESEREPLLRILAESDLTEVPTASVSYAGQRYVISDRPGEMRNRFAFQILQFLSTQVELDTNQLPTQQLIQVR